MAYAVLLVDYSYQEQSEQHYQVDGKQNVHALLVIMLEVSDLNPIGKTWFVLPHYENATLSLCFRFEVRHVTRT